MSDEHDMTEKTAEAETEPTFMTARDSIEQVFNSLDPVLRAKVEEEVRVLVADPTIDAQLLWAVLIWGNTQVQHLAQQLDAAGQVINQQGQVIASQHKLLEGIRKLLRHMPEARVAAELIDEDEKARQKEAEDNGSTEGA